MYVHQLSSQNITIVDTSRRATKRDLKADRRQRWEEQRTGPGDGPKAAAADGDPCHLSPHVPDARREN